MLPATGYAVGINIYMLVSETEQVCCAVISPNGFGLIKVRILDRDSPKLKFPSKCTTKCNEQVVRIRPGGWSVGRTREEVCWVEACEFFEDVEKYQVAETVAGSTSEGSGKSHGLASQTFDADPRPKKRRISKTGERT